MLAACHRNTSNREKNPTRVVADQVGMPYHAPLTLASACLGLPPQSLRC